MNPIARIIITIVLPAVWLSAMAQPSAPPAPQNVVLLVASGSIEIQQDWLTLSMNTTRDGPDAATVQAQLKTAVDGALAEARKAAQAGQMDVRTGNFSLIPRYGRDGKMTGWQGTAEMVLEGRDIARIGATAGRVQTLTIAGLAFGLSKEQRSKAESEAQTLAIERFKGKSADIAKAFGFAGFSLREVSVNTSDQGVVPRPRVMAMDARAASADMPVPLEAGKSSVVVTVSGSIQLK